MHFQISKTTLGPVSFRSLGHGQRKILFFHGFPGSSAQIAVFNNLTDPLGLEVLCFDRPGYNDTPLKTSNSIDDTVKIADELVHSRGWKQFEIVSVSGGTPFGISYAKKYPNKIKSIRVICGLGDLTLEQVKKSFSIVSLGMLRLLPKISGLLLQKVLTIPTKAGRNHIISYFLPASKPDLQSFHNPEVLHSLHLALTEAVKQRALGPKQDSVVFLTNWSNEIGDLKMPIHFWHGDSDHIISSKTSEEMCSLFPNSGITIVKNEGHISLPVNRMNEILSFKFSKTL